MSKITLDSVASGYDLSKINANFALIAAALNDEVLYRDNPVGETNTLLTEVDCNSKSLYNLPTPTLSHQVTTKEYVDTAPTSAAAAALASQAAAAISETNAAASAADAAASVVTVSDQKIVWLGAWSGATAYVVNDAVSSGGNSYICTAGNTNQVPPNASYWDVLAAKGAAGAGTGDMLAANNLSDVANTATARTNLGVQIGADVLAYIASASQVEMEAGTEAGLRAMSPLRVAQAIAALTSNSVATGTIIDFGGSAAPTGYLACDGAAVSRTTYATLFTAIGILWGVGDGVTTFNVPNIPASYATVQSAGTVGASTTGVVKAHTHIVGSSAGAASGSFGYVAGDTGSTASSSTGSAANLAAGVHTLKCIKT